MESSKKNEQPCPTCGGRSYSWGSLNAQGVNFTPDDASLLRKFFRVGLTPLPARRCNDCGNVQLFVDPPGADA